MTIPMYGRDIEREGKVLAWREAGFGAQEGRGNAPRRCSDVEMLCLDDPDRLYESGNQDH